MKLGWEDMRGIEGDTWRSAYYWACAKVETAHARHEIISIEHFGGQAFLAEVLRRAMKDLKLYSPLKLL